MPNPVAEAVALLRSIGGPTREEAADLLADLIERQQAEIERLSREGADHEAVHASHRQLVRRLDVILNGETGAAPQARLCDVVAQLERLSRERDKGVPEGFWLAPNELDDAMIEACAGAFFAAFDKRVSGSRPFHRWYEAIRAAAPQPPTVSTQGWQDGALKDIGIERLRQMSVEGWTPEHDDTHDQFEMARAAAFYCVTTYAETLPEPTPDEPSNRYSAFHTADCAWPSTWDGCWRKPKDARRNLVRAAALIVAEIERLDRANGVPPAHVQPDLSTLTRERDQAREALELAEPILAAVSMLLREDRILVCRDEILTAALQRARSVLHPEKEEKA